MKRWMFVAALCLLPVLAWSAPKPKKSKPLPVPAETAVHTQHSVSIDGQTGRYDERFSSLELQPLLLPRPGSDNIGPTMSSICSS